MKIRAGIDGEPGVVIFNEREEKIDRLTKEQARILARTLLSIASDLPEDFSRPRNYYTEGPDK